MTRNLRAEELAALTLFRKDGDNVFEGGYSLRFYSPAWGRWVSVLFAFEDFEPESVSEERKE